MTGTPVDRRMSAAPPGGRGRRGLLLHRPGRAGPD